ncbi:MAG: formate dehydrogenase subunit alpha [Alphaproteobacteria bacterium]|nr:formate dehydrogenase subunit alpha [Alphaproteobacteria bacterium]MBU0798584.1 formate dehydrogenase subunit alpha [Alphaproteobacteria bacterium]MBU0888139.1 formate dehydrogenase subunit alpha [Alphaproteobacteria bacterium]MBU1811584.1 formate dehydrogenase subunit alpha [Alphaproteobacteria bacterium]
MTTGAIRFTLDGREVDAAPGETLWQVAQRLGTEIPHLCHRPEPGYRPDGNCRACMVEIDGERTLAASCIRQPAPGMMVKTASERAKASRRTIFELLLADQPAQPQAHDPASTFWHWAEAMEIADSRFPKRAARPKPDSSHPAIAVNMDACIQCNLCVRACREVQVNDVIGMAGRGHNAEIVFDFGDPMGDSTCVACGECVQACPTGALMPASLLNEAGLPGKQPERAVDSLCPYCGVGCQLTFQVADNRILAVDGRDGPANHNRLCVKGRYGFDYVHSKERLTKPLIRREDAPKDRSLDIDPANPLTHFREASWEEALERAATGLARIRDTNGPNALAGFGSAKGSNEEAYLFQKLVRTGFGTNNIDHCTRLCHASSVAALIEGIGSGAVTAPFYECANSDVIIVIGATPTVNHPVAATFIKNAVKRGARLIVIDPRGQGLTRHADLHLQFRGGTDVALLNAMIHTIIEEELTDTGYIARHTEDFATLKARVAEYSPEKMEPLCGIPAETLRRTARLYAGAKAAMIFWGMGISQHTHGTDNARCLIALALLTGNIGKPGAGLHPLRGQNNVQGASDAGLIPMFLPDYRPVEDSAIREIFEAVWGTPIDPHKGLTVVEIMDAAHRGEIRGMYIMGENPAMSDPDQTHVREALAKLDHLVVQEIFLTETAAFADVILPATAFPEKDGSFTNTNRQVQIGRKAIDAPGEARQDWWIIQELANRLGLGWSYGHPRDAYEEMRGLMPSIRGISWERLEREGSVTYPCDSADDPGQEVIFGDGFPTESGKARFVATDIRPPDEMPDEDYPFILTTGRILEHWHTGAMTRRATVLDAIEPEPFCHVSAEDLGRAGILPGDQIRVRTRRGAIELKARLDRDVPSGTIFIPFCYAEAAANFLTNPALDPDGKIPELKYCAARLERTNQTAAE